MKDKLVVWPANIDAQKSRKDGRKIAEKYAINAPTLGEIEASAEKLNLNPVVEKDKAYPKEWWEVSGRVLIDKTKPKSILLKEIAKEIRKLRK